MGKKKLSEKTAKGASAAPNAGTAATSHSESPMPTSAPAIPETGTTSFFACVSF